MFNFVGLLLHTFRIEHKQNTNSARYTQNLCLVSGEQSGNAGECQQCSNINIFSTSAVEIIRVDLISFTKEDLFYIERTHTAVHNSFVILFTLATL